MLKKFVLSIALLAAAGVATFLVLDFVIDIRTPVSQKTVMEATISIAAVPKRELDSISASLKARYPDAIIHTVPYGIAARINDVIVAKESASMRVERVYGLSVIGKGDAASFFPFAMGPDVEPAKPVNEFAENIRMLSDAWFPDRSRFDNRDVVIEPCRKASARELGFPVAGFILGLSDSSFCAVETHKNTRQRMLAGVVFAGQGLWLRPFARGTCRMFAKAWLASMGPQFKADYVRCIVVDRPTVFPWGPVAFSETFEIGGQGKLARVPPLEFTSEGQAPTDLVPLRPSAPIPGFTGPTFQ